jgi:hypothetical protein
MVCDDLSAWSFVYLLWFMIRLPVCSSDAEAIGIEGGLLSLVQLLHTIVMDIYMLFFYRIPISASTTTLPPSGRDHVNGLLAFYSLQLTCDLRQRFSPTAGYEIPFPHSVVIDEKQQMKIARQWLDEQLKKVTDKCSSLLHSLTSATQVAQLQQQVFASCNRTSAMNVSLIAPQSPLSLTSTYPTVWKEACVELLVHKSARHRRVVTTTNNTANIGTGNLAQPLSLSTTTTNEPVDTALILWSTVFRASFLHQVERLLQRSCEDILCEVRRRVMWELSLLGVVVDLLTAVGTPLQISFSKTENHHFKSSSISSAKIFIAAERIRAYFDSALGQLLEEVITPVSCGGCDVHEFGYLV